MKKILLVLLLVSMYQVKGQEVLKSQFGDTITLYRYKSAKDVQLNNRVAILEKALDYRKELVKQDKGTFLSDDFAGEFTLIRDVAPAFDVSVYKKEITFYNKYLTLLKAARKQKEDSIQLAEGIAHNARLDAEKKRKDSINAIKTPVKEDEFPKLKNFVGGSHMKLVLFCGHPIQYVMTDFSMFLSDNLQFKSVDDKRKSPPKNAATQAFASGLSNTMRNIYVDYYGSNVGKEWIVEKAVITGPWIDVATVFVKYWETRMNFEELKGKTEVFKYTGTDKIIFISDLKTNSATVKVVPNK